jgi:hypothetical protein
MAKATNSNSTEESTNSTSSEKYDKYQNFSAIKEHELDYKRRLRRSEFTEGLSKEELIERANTSKTASSAKKPQNKNARNRPVMT